MPQRVGELHPYLGGARAGAVGGGGRGGQGRGQPGRGLFGQGRALGGVGGAGQQGQQDAAQGQVQFGVRGRAPAPAIPSCAVAEAGLGAGSWVR
ncbi:hypothetical protein ACFWNO_47890, partial [Streptomyces sp. NPDC058394]